MLEAILVGIIDAVLLRKTMQFCSGVDTPSRRALTRQRRLDPLNGPDPHTRHRELHNAALAQA